MENIEGTALITGCSSGIGLAIAQTLLDTHQSLRVVGLSRQVGPLEAHPRFQHWTTDLSVVAETRKRATRFLQAKHDCPLLVHAAGAGLFSPSTEWTAEQVEALVNLNLTSPMLLTGSLTQKLRKSQAMVVFIGSTSSRERAPLGAAYAATKSGLHHFSENYFQENRKHGVRVLHLCPGMTTDTDFYATERFTPKNGSDFSLVPGQLADLVKFFFSGPGRNLNPTHLVVEPQKVGIEKS